MTTTSCCGRAPRDISIDLPDSVLAFVYCEHCESRQWFRNGEPVSLSTVKADASAQWNKRDRVKTAVVA
jgi:hypothetical protein